MRPEVLAGIGGFGAMIEIPEGRWKRPVLVAGTDGVGTKLRLAIDTGLHDGVGQDLVAMCANDVVVQGAEPLFFLDYYATGRLSVDVAERVIAGIAEGCASWRAARSSAARPRRCPACTRRATTTSPDSASASSSATASSTAAARAPGDAVIGLASSGPHSNGYSLIRRLIAETGATTRPRVGGARLIDVLMAPTRIYVKSLLRLAAAVDVHGFAHITGGGLTDNIPRVLPDGLARAARSARLAAGSGLGLDPDERPHQPMPKCIARSTAASA